MVVGNGAEVASVKLTALAGPQGPAGGKDQLCCQTGSWSHDAGHGKHGKGCLLALGRTHR